MTKCTLEPAEIVRLYEIEHWTLKRIGEAAGVSPARVRDIRDRYVRHRKVEASSYARPRAHERDRRAIWTIYDRPNDYPESFVAREFQFCANHLGRDYTSPTGETMVGSLEDIRVRFERTGLVKICRQESDAPQIVESWI